MRRLFKNISNRSILVVLCIFTVLSLIFSSEHLFRTTIFLAFATCIILGLRQNNMINPYVLFSITPLSLLLYKNLGGIYMLDLSDKVWRLAIINIFAFIFTIFFTPSYKRYSNCIGLNRTSILIISSICFYLLSFIGGYIPQLNALFWFLSVAAIVCAIKTKKRIMYAFCAVVILSSILSGHTSKMAVLLQCITILVCYDKYFVNTKAKKKKLFLLSVLGAILMVSAFSFANKERGRYDAEVGVNYYMDQGHIEWNYSSAIFMPYMYLTTPWTNLEYIVETQNTRTSGLWAIKPILGYIGLDENLKHKYELTPYSTFNTFTFIAVLFKDFGFWGSVILSIFLGYFVKKIYSRYTISKSPFDITSYILVALATAEMFFSNHFFMQSYPFTCLIIMELWKSLINLLRISKIELEN